MKNSASEIGMPEQDQTEKSEIRLLESIALENLLSYGPGHQPFKLATLNVLIGPNGSGKSNLIEAISLLRATPKDLPSVVRKGGGVTDWLWKGAEGKAARVEAGVLEQEAAALFRHSLELAAAGQRFVLQSETIRVEDDSGDPLVAYLIDGGEGSFSLSDAQESPVAIQDPDHSILAQRWDPNVHPTLAQLAENYEKIRIYRDWSFGRNTIFRQPQAADMRNDRLEEDFSNLGLFLNRLRRLPAAKRQILERLQDLYEGLQDFDVSIEGGTVQLFLQEEDFIIPATRLSDGTLRYLYLLAILCDPEPPPLICIEEPELGLHPDVIPKIADLLVEASERTQLIVTTHSDILVDALTETPESIVICEKHDGQTQLKRLDQEELEAWLKEYRLGELWTRGELGRTRRRGLPNRSSLDFRRQRRRQAAGEPTPRAGAPFSSWLLPIRESSKRTCRTFVGSS